MFRIQLLGGFQLWIDDVPFQQATPARLQELIAYLLLHAGVPQSRLHVASLFWPDASEEQARGNLRKALHDLRRLLPEIDTYIQGDRQYIVWRRDAPYRLDVAAFEEAAAKGSNEDAEVAIQLYGGDFLSSCYDDWVLTERERLRRRFLALLTGRLAEAEHQRAYGRAIEYAERLLHEEPLEEEAYRTLMRLYALLGDPGRALGVYHRCTAILEQELGVEPSEGTREVYERLIRQHDTASALPSAPRLIGRSEEWAQLHASWRGAAQGRAQALLLVGEPGIGKTRLLEELRVWATRQGIVTLSAQCYEAEARLAYAPIGALLRSAPIPELDHVSLAEIARVVPEVHHRHPDLPVPGPLSEPWQQTRLFNALAHAVLGRQPIVVILDDIHWADEGTLDWLHYLVRFDRTARLLVACATRPEGRSSDDRRLAFWEDLRLESRLAEIDLAPLDPAASLELARSAAGDLDDEQVRALYRETEGNPFFILEMLRESSVESGTVPQSIQAQIGARLSRLTPEARELAEFAATIGREFHLTTLEMAWPHGYADLARSLDELWLQRIVRERGPEAYDFSHDKLRQATYNGIRLARRRLLHATVAHALEATAGEQLEAMSGEIARHFEEAGAPDRAATYHLRAGDAARRVFANAVAIDHYGRAAQTFRGAEQIDALRRLGETLQASGDLPAAERAFRRGIALAVESRDEYGAARCRYGLATVLRMMGEHQEAIDQLEQARAAFARRGDHVLHSAALSQLGIIWTVQGEADLAADLLEAATRVAAEAQDKAAELVAVGALGYLYLHRFHLGFDRAERYLSRELELARELHEDRHLITSLGNLGLVRMNRGEYLGGLDHLLEAYAVAEAIGDRANAAAVASNLGYVYRLLGRVEEATRCCVVAAELAMQTEYSLFAYLSLSVLGHIWAGAGRLSEAEPLLERAVAGFQTGQLPFQLAEALCFLADLRERQGSLDEASCLAGRAACLARKVGRQDYELVGQIMQIRLAVARGEYTREVAIGRFECLKSEWEEPRQRAALVYAIWRLDPSRDQERKTATEIYGAIYPSRPNALYRQRYFEMTGEHLPLAETPQLPEAIRLYPGSIDELVQRVLNL